MITQEMNQILKVIILIVWSWSESLVLLLPQIVRSQVNFAKNFINFLCKCSSCNLTPDNIWQSNASLRLVKFTCKIIYLLEGFVCNKFSYIIIKYTVIQRRVIMVYLHYTFVEEEVGILLRKQRTIEFWT